MLVAKLAATSGSMAAPSDKLLQRLGAGSVQALGQWPRLELPTAAVLMPAGQLNILVQHQHVTSALHQHPCFSTEARMLMCCQYWTLMWLDRLAVKLLTRTFEPCMQCHSSTTMSWCNSYGCGWAFCKSFLSRLSRLPSATQLIHCCLGAADA